MHIRIHRLFATVAIAAGVFSIILPAKAAVYQAGTLVRIGSEPAIYYVARDGERYVFPNAETFHTWYRDFRHVKTIGAEEAKTLPLSDKPVTVHPGTVLVKFRGDTKVYAVGTGATLRWLMTEQVAKTLYGYDWPARVITLPLDNQMYYTTGDPIGNASEFDRNRTINTARTIDAELSNQDAIGETKESASPGREETATSKSTNGTASSITYAPVLHFIGSNLKNGIRPNFHPDTTSYRQVAEATEASVELFLSAPDPNARITAKGLEVVNGKSVRLPLTYGRNRIPVRVVTAEGKERTYFLTITRNSASNNNLLSNLDENLEENLSPQFHPSEREYTLAARYHEETVVLRATTDDPRAKLKIGSESVSSGWNHTIRLQFGENKVPITVTSEGGSERVYTLIIRRSLFPNHDALDLSSLKTNLSGEMRPAFDPKVQTYVFRARPDEERTEIVARAKYWYAHVLIDGEETERKSVKLSPGRNEVTVTVEIDESHQRSYRLIIDKLLDF